MQQSMHPQHSYNSLPLSSMHQSGQYGINQQQMIQHQPNYNNMMSGHPHWVQQQQCHQVFI